ncbi:MAG: (S)-ureidoglycine aminohydrolase, partial [Rhodobacteraceae bacterium]|nr:(S)-ureidoglycine aminohydrolase [Paracoccaceae bacterium]
MTQRTYATPPAGLPPQSDRPAGPTGRARFTEAYAVIPRTTMRDIVTSALPYWDDARAWILARPMTGFAETFSQYIMEVAPGGGSDTPESDPQAQAALFVVEGTATLTVGGQTHQLAPGGFAYLPPASKWTLHN